MTGLLHRYVGSIGGGGGAALLLRLRAHADAAAAELVGQALLGAPPLVTHARSANRRGADHHCRHCCDLLWSDAAAARHASTAVAQLTHLSARSKALSRAPRARPASAEARGRRPRRQTACWGPASGGRARCWASCARAPRRCSSASPRAWPPRPRCPSSPAAPRGPTCGPPSWLCSRVLGHAPGRLADLRGVRHCGYPALQRATLAATLGLPRKRQVCWCGAHARRRRPSQSAEAPAARAQAPGGRPPSMQADPLAADVRRLGLGELLLAAAEARPGPEALDADGRGDGAAAAAAAAAAAECGGLRYGEAFVYDARALAARLGRPLAAQLPAVQRLCASMRCARPPCVPPKLHISAGRPPRVSARHARGCW